MNAPVAVVIPTYNRCDVLPEAVESALAQTWPAREIVVVDDGSRDETAAVMAPYVARGVRYLRRTNGGNYAARNTGVAVTAAPLVAFLDDDDVWQPDKLERFVAFMSRWPTVGAVFSDVEKLDGTTRVPSFARGAPVFGAWLGARRRTADVVPTARAMYLSLLQEIAILPSALMVRRDAFDRAGGFDESWRSFGDWEFCLRFARTERFGYIDAPLTTLRVSPDSIHRVDAVPGRTATIALLLRERARVRGDREALAAIRRGVAHQRKHIGWYYRDTGRPAAAARNYVRGFLEVGDIGLALRAVAAWLPPWRRPRAADAVHGQPRARSSVAVRDGSAASEPTSTGRRGLPHATAGRRAAHPD
jgi:glycosyltransferase involved in cell wall biosynthesis